MRMARERKGQAGVNNIMGLLIFIVLVLGAVIPVTTNMISSSNLSGTSATLLALVPTFLIIGIIVVVWRSMVGG